MKFLAHGDSVVALRFKHLREAGPSRSEELAAAEKGADLPKNALNALKRGVESRAAAKISESLEKLDARVDKITARGLTKDAERTAANKQTRDKPVVAFAGAPKEVTAKMAETQKPVADFLSNLQAELTQTTLGGSPEAVYAQA